MGLNSPAEQKEILSKEISPSGAGEDPAIQALLSEEFTTMNDLDALTVATAVAKIVRGEVREEIDGTMAGLKQLLADMQDTAKKAEEDRLKFAEDLFNSAEKVRNQSNEDTAVRSVELLRQAKVEAKANTLLKRERINNMVKTAKPVSMVHPGIARHVRINGVKQTIMDPFKIYYEHLVYTFPPNRPTEIPDFVYEAFLEQAAMREKRDGLKTALAGATQHYGKAIQAEAAVDPTYAQRVSEEISRAGMG